MLGLSFLQLVARVFLVISSLLFITLGVLLAIWTGDLKFGELLFILLGIIQLGLVIGYLLSSTRSSQTVNIYLGLLAVLVSLQVILSALSFAFKTKIINWTIQNHLERMKEMEDFGEYIRTRIIFVLYFSLGVSILQVVAVIFICLYRAKVPRKASLDTSGIQDGSYILSKDSYPDEKFWDPEDKRVDAIKNKMKKEVTNLPRSKKSMSNS